MDRFFGAAFDGILRRRKYVIAVLGALLVLGAIGAMGIEMDMSFRPLFSDRDDVGERTERFESEFGQSSGAQVVVIIEPDGVRGNGFDDGLFEIEFLREVRALTREIASVEHISEVRSLTDFPHVVIGGDQEPVVANGIAAELLAADVSGRGQLPDWLIGTLQGEPRLKRTLIAESGEMTQVIARLDLPLEDLVARSEVIDEIRRVVASHAPSGAKVRITGLSVVEQAYADIVLRNLFISIAALVAMMLVLLWVHFRDLRAVVVCMTGVTIALPMTLGAMAVLGYKITIVNSQVLTMVVIVGVTHAIHMQEEYWRECELGEATHSADRRMFVRLGMPCLMTSLTTLAGFLSLRTAGIAAIRDFGVSVSIGLVIVFFVNLAVVPLMLGWLERGANGAHDRGGRWTIAVLGWVDRTVHRRPALTILVSVAFFVTFSAVGIPRIALDQYFNEELNPGHPINDDQRLYEEEFSGFLGPDIHLTAEGSRGLLSAERLAAIAKFDANLRAMSEVLWTTSLLDHVPSGTSGTDAHHTLDVLGEDPQLSATIHEAVNENADGAGMLVRTTDMGTDRAGSFVADIERLAHEDLEPAGIHAEVVGQWWLAQRGMRRLLKDLVTSVLAALLLVLPIVWISVRRWRLFLVSILPTVMPIAAALAFMGLAGITVRVGTAMILAIALGLAVDDTIHLLVRIRIAREVDGMSAREAVTATLMRTGRPASFSSYVLTGGFATMLLSEINALRDMGLVAVVTMILALGADLLLGPALFLATERDGISSSP